MSFSYREIKSQFGRRATCQNSTASAGDPENAADRVLRRPLPAFPPGEYTAGIMMKTEHGYQDPSVTQIAVFLQNRVGELWDVLRHLDAAQVTVLAVSVADSVDYAIVRLIVDDLEAARLALRDAKFAITESTLLCVELPDERSGLMAVCRALIQAEINIHYAYPMLARPNGRCAVVVHLDSRPNAIDVLRRNGFTLLEF